MECSYTFGKVFWFSLTNKVEIGNSTLYSHVLDQEGRTSSTCRVHIILSYPLVLNSRPNPGFESYPLLYG